MIDVVQAPDGIVEVRAGGKLTRADYKDVLLPRRDALIAASGKLNVLFQMDETFTGWTLDAAWENTVLDFRHRGDFAKIAAVGARQWEDWCVKFAASLLMRGELRSFRREQLEQARAWLKA
ncbi:MAG: STAS/SEC14 domain-containing protein [Pseudolabrys sp.]